jgi:hypothetical protein
MFDPRRYLETELPRLLAAASTPALPAKICIQWVVADRSDCDLVYRIAPSGEVSVSAEIADDSDLTLSFVSKDLDAFSRHELDVARALVSKRLTVTGDHELLAWMAERLAIVASGKELVR